MGDAVTVGPYIHLDGDGLGEGPSSERRQL
jgi:hypothetical protein